MAEKREIKKKVRKLQYSISKDRVWFTLMRENEVDNIYKGKVSQVNIYRFFLRPFVLLQNFLFTKKIDNINIDNKNPIFIIGHWRSGTTHLHYIFHKDSQFGTLSNYQTFSYTFSLLSQFIVKMVFGGLMPKERTQDNVKMDADKPGEEEQPLSNTSIRSGLHSWFFFRNFSYFNKYNLFKGITLEEKSAWQKDYMRVVKTISYSNQQKQLVLKNPHNTGRVKELLEIFPNAKFVFIHRNPYEVFISTLHLFSKVIETQFFQYATISERKEMILYMYKETMSKYLQDRDSIPKGNLVEVPFDKFTENNMASAESLYKDLGLKGFETAKPHIKEYLDSVKTYKKNKFREIDPDIKEKIQKEWKFAFDEWNYDL